MASNIYKVTLELNNEKEDAIKALYQEKEWDYVRVGKFLTNYNTL